MKLRESTYDNRAGTALKVYPHLGLDKPDVWMASAGSVDALPYWDEGGQKTWGVEVNISYRYPLTREKSDQLKAAIDRCWEWIDDQQPAP